MAPRPTCECGECRKCKRRAYMKVWYAANAEKVRAAARRYREENLERVQAYDRERGRSEERRAEKRRRERGLPQTEAERRWQIENRERQNAANREWKRRNPEKVRAHSLLAYHIRAGNLSRQPCEVCGAEKTDAHHDDYGKPKDVRWLCHLHHMELHRVEVA